MNDKNVLWACTPSAKEIDIPILGICGEFGSGKSMFAITIAPGVFPEGHPFAHQNRTGVIDAEKSTETYAKMLPFDRVDLPAEILKTRRTGFNAMDLYQEFIKQINQIPNNRYDVLVVDPITDIDSGLTEFVKTNCIKFGLTSKQLEKSSGLLWGVVKDEWNRLLLQIAQKCKTFVFTAHMRDVYIGNIPSGKREPKGKETLAKLATLYLKLDRSPVHGQVPKVPRGVIVMEKSRLCDITLLPDGSIKIDELIPHAFDDCTPNRIREYIRHPGAEGTAIPEEFLSNDARLAFQAIIETNRNEAKQAELELFHRQRDLVSMHNTALLTPTATLEASQTKTKELIKNIFDSSSLHEADTPQSPKHETPTPTEPNVAPTLAPPTLPETTMGAAECAQKIFEAFKSGLFTVQERDQLCQQEHVEKVSQLPHEKLLNLWDGVCLMKFCFELADKMKMPRPKLDELARLHKGESFFLSSLTTKKLIRQYIEDEAKKAAIDFISF